MMRTTNDNQGETMTDQPGPQWGPPGQQPPPGGQYPPQGGPPAKAPKKRKKWPFIVGGVILLIIIISIASNSGGSKTNTAAATSTAAAPTTTSAAPAPTTQQAAAPAPTTTGCTLPTNKPDLIEREITPNLPPHALLIGAVNFASCTLTVDSFAATSPTGPGYCTQIAAAADNAGYNVDAPATRPLRNLIDQVGGAC